MSDRSVILLVDDEPADVQLLQRAFLKSKVLNPFKAVKNGEEAIAYLSGEGIYANRAEYPLPGLVLLDLNMPKLSGFDVLK